MEICPGKSSRIKAVIIEDDRDLAEILAFRLENEGWDAVIALDGRKGLDQVNAELPDLVILDLMLPGMGGMEICRHLRRQENTANIPIIMVTARGNESDRLSGFEVGADDYVVKPFSTSELMMRIKAVLRRSQSFLPPDGKVLTFGMLTIDTGRHRITVDNREINLTAIEFKLLLILAERRGCLLSRKQLLADVWDYGRKSDSRTLDTHITRLRSKLGPAGSIIHTIRGYGYRLDPT